MGGAALRRRLGPMCCRTARCWRMARPRAHTQPARWLRVREAERARDVCSVPAATAARAAAAERAALGACAERSAGSEADCEARARHDHRDGDPGAQRLLTGAAQHSCSPALLGNSTFRDDSSTLAGSIFCRSSASPSPVLPCAFLRSPSLCRCSLPLRLPATANVSLSTSLALRKICSEVRATLAT